MIRSRVEACQAVGLRPAAVNRWKAFFVCS
jgi:hypothetical protein